MANKLIQHLTLADLTDIEEEQLLKFVKASLIATQQSYFDSYVSGGDIDFELLEGSVHYDITTDVYTFTPRKSLRNLLKKVENNEATELKGFLESRFYKMIETVFKIEKGELKPPLKRKPRIRNNKSKGDK